MDIKVGTTIPKDYPYAGFIVTAVSSNGWCKGYYPSNVQPGGTIRSALTSVRAHWLVGVNAVFNLVPSQR